MSRGKNDDTLIFEGIEVKAKSQKALLIDFGTGESHWIPLSQITDHDNTSVEMTRWIAEQKGLA
jgi:hypothetical protein